MAAAPHSVDRAAAPGYPPGVPPKPPPPTARLRFCRPRAADMPFLLRLFADKRVMRHIATLTPAQARERLGFFMSQWDADGHGACLLRLKDGTPVGLAGIRMVRIRRRRRPDLGFAFMPRHWGKGYAREAIAAALADGFGRLGFASVWARTSPRNPASITLLRGAGFLPRGRAGRDTLIWRLGAARFKTGSRRRGLTA